LANHKSALKRARQNEKKRMINKGIKTRVKNISKEVIVADSEDMAKTIVTAQSIIDKAAKKGVIHKKTAARKISRLSKFVNTKAQSVNAAA
jgi:small subunit ribosomal protein S20